MATRPAAILDLVTELKDDWYKNRDEVDRVDSWLRGPGDKPLGPNKQLTSEMRSLVDRSGSPWMKRVVTGVAQVLFVEGYRGSSSDSPSEAMWRVWQANRLDRGQSPVHYGALGHGIAHVTVLPGTLPFSGEPMPILRGKSARRMHATYADPAVDEWPLWALERDVFTTPTGEKVKRWKLWDADRIWTIDETASGSELVTWEDHPARVCPVVRFTNDLDLDGRVTGEVAPLIPIASRIDQDTFDRLVVQRFAAWKVRYATGMAAPENKAEQDRVEQLLRTGDILVNESPDGRFGTLDETPLDGYLKAFEQDIHTLAAVSQTPPHTLIGSMINLSAEALAAAEAGLQRKAKERQHSFGESWEQAFRLAAFLQGDTTSAFDYEAEVLWEDMESRSLAQAADALGKMATMLGVPARALWERIPGVTSTEAAWWAEMAMADDELSRLFAEFTEGPDVEGPPVEDV